MGKLIRYLKDYKKQAIFGPMFKLVEAVFELIVPLVMIQIIDVGVANRDTGYVLKMGGVLVLLAAVGLCSTLFCQYFASVASQGVGTSLRRALYKKINTFSHRELDTFGTHSLITRITNDVNQIQVAVAMLIRLAIRAPFLAIGALFMAFTIDVQLSLILAVALVFIALVLYLIMSRSVPFFRVMQKKLDKISLITRENLSGARVIRAFLGKRREEKRFAEASDDLAQTAVRVGRLSALLNPLTFSIMNIGIVLVLWFGGARIQIGGFTQGEVIAIVNYMNQILLALVVVANLVVIFTKASASATRVEEVLATQSTILDPAEAKSGDGPKGTAAVRFDHVSFDYNIVPGSGPKTGSANEDEEPALIDCDLTFLKGQTIGIIGGTGSGKSTLVQLIPRLYDVTQGAVFVDGQDVREYPLDALREKIGYVPQQAQVLSGSIRENLLWGKKDATEEELWQALTTAQAKDFVEGLPEKLEAHITQGGKSLSGGQRQRLTIARALVRKPEILILDDSLSALDFATDMRLRKALRQDTKDMTVFFVTQRASSIRRADQIVVLDDGRVAGVGKHEELFESCPVYREICLSQQSKEEASRA